MSQSFTDEQLKAIDKVQKLMALAAGNANEHEAAVATERANFILAQLNLSMDDLAATDAQAGKAARGKDKLVGGFYQHERDMWKAIAELNFCWYECVKVHYDFEKAKKEGRKYAHHHSLIGRNVNILATKLMADYLLQTLERLTREYCDLERPYEKWHPRSSTAVSFRKGAAERLIEKINERRRAILAEERRKEEEQRKAQAHPGAAPTATALVVSGLIKSEYEANYDFKYGEGAYARALARQNQWEEEAKQRALEHERKLLSDPAYKARHEKEMAEALKRARRSRGRTYREPQFKGDSAARYAGYERAGSVSLDSQIERTEQKRIK
jgi:hypothetical protein